MSYYQEPPPSQEVMIPLPVSKPQVTYWLLGAIVLIWLFLTGQTVVGDQNYNLLLIAYGAIFGPLVLEGEIWRFFTAMFLHGDLMHLAFNSYALFAFGLHMESIYGTPKFLTVYTLSGLMGSLLSFATWGPDSFSVGASGAIFGIIGMQLVFFWLHKDKFGDFGRQQVSSMLVIIGLNLVLGFTLPNIDNMGHIGGLIGGCVLGFGLAPRYQLLSAGYDAQLVDTVSLANRWWFVGVIACALVMGTQGALMMWQ